MFKPDERLSKSFSDWALLDAIALQVIAPERQRPLADGECRRLHLTRALPSRLAAIRKRRHDGAGLQDRVRIIQVVDRNRAVHQNGLLRHAKAENVRKEIHIFLGSTRAS